MIKKSVCSVEVYLAVGICCVVAYVSVMPFLSICEYVNGTIGYIEKYIYYSTDTFMLTLNLFVTLILGASFLSIQDRAVYEYVRISRLKWTFIQTINLFWINLLLQLFINVFLLLVKMNNCQMLSDWSMILRQLERNADYGIKRAFFSYPNLFRYSPLKIFILSLGLQVIYGFFMSLVMYICICIFGYAKGFFMSVFFHELEKIICSWYTIRIQKYTLWGNCLIVYHCIKDDDLEGYIPIVYSLKYLTTVLLLLLIVIVILAKRRDIGCSAWEK